MVLKYLLRSGVVAGLADPRLAKTLNAMHSGPARSSTLQGLAQRTRAAA